MAQYDAFAPFYDAVNGEPEQLISLVLGAIARFEPGARSVLELGCGTGAVLAGLGSELSLAGIDLSDSMLGYARRRCPGARLVQGDIRLVDLGTTFDVVICVLDTLNHVTTFEGWQSVFSRAAAHLREGGLFIFDVNTIGRFRELGDTAPWVHDFDGHTLVMDVDFSHEPLALWNIRIFEQTSGDTFRLRHETITELGVALDEVRGSLLSEFDLLEESDFEGGPPDDNSARAFFVMRRRSRGRS